MLSGVNNRGLKAIITMEEFMTKDDFLGGVESGESTALCRSEPSGGAGGGEPELVARRRRVFGGARCAAPSAAASSSDSESDKRPSSSLAGPPLVGAPLLPLALFWTRLAFRCLEEGGSGGFGRGGEGEALEGCGLSPLPSPSPSSAPL